jgi:hypothetical protein
MDSVHTSRALEYTFNESLGVAQSSVALVSASRASSTSRPPFTTRSLRNAAKRARAVATGPTRNFAFVRLFAAARSSNGDARATPIVVVVVASVRARRDARRVVPSAETDESPASSSSSLAGVASTRETFALRDEDDDHRARLARESNGARGTLERVRVDIADDL